MRTLLRNLGLCCFALFAVAAGVDCAAAGGGAGGSGGAGGQAALTTTVQVTVVGVGLVEAAGKTTTESCARDAQGMVTGNCITQWAQGDAPKLTAKEQDPAWKFQSWNDTETGNALGMMSTFQVSENSTLNITALFLQQVDTTSTGTCGGMNCGCPNNVCPEPVAEGIASVAGLVERGTDLYYLGTVDKLAKSGGKPTTIVNGAVGAFAVDDTSVFWVDGTGASLWRANLDGTGTTKLTQLDSLQYLHALAVDATDVYITMLQNKGMGDCIVINRAPKAGGALTEVAETCDSPGLAKPYAIAINSTNVFWGTVLMPKGGSIYSAPKTGNAVIGTALVTNANFPVTRIVADDKTIFYLQNGIRMLDAQSPGMPTQVGTTMMTISSFTIDANDVFVVGGAVSKVDRQTQNEVLLASESGSTVTVDATDVYWASGSPGAVKILKIPKQ